MKCIVDDCQKTANAARGLCHKHYRRLRVNGDVNSVKRISGKMPLEERFSLQTKLNERTGCLEWTGAIASNGYGTVKVGTKSRGAHRAAFEMVCGKVPKGLFVCHKCDNKRCVKIDHLFLGTPKQNTQDAVIKGRMGRTDPDMDERKQIAVSSGESAKELAAYLNVHWATVYKWRKAANRRMGGT
jgi:hypothetical protein